VPYTPITAWIDAIEAGPGLDCRPYSSYDEEDDVDGDGDIDLVFHFRLGDTTITCESTTGTLRGETFDAQAIRGTDAVRMIDPGPFESPLLHDGG
jgi:hypothetical protein